MTVKKGHNNVSFYLFHLHLKCWDQRMAKKPKSLRNSYKFHTGFYLVNYSICKTEPLILQVVKLRPREMVHIIKVK